MINGQKSKRILHWTEHSPLMWSITGSDQLYWIKFSHTIQPPTKSLLITKWASPEKGPRCFLLRCYNLSNWRLSVYCLEMLLRHSTLLWAQKNFGNEEAINRNIFIHYSLYHFSWQNRYWRYLWNGQHTLKIN